MATKGSRRDKYYIRCSVGGGHRASGRLFSLNVEEMNIKKNDGLLYLTGSKILNILQNDIDLLFDVSTFCSTK